ncbi:MAG: cell division protein ZapA [Bacteroidales bacterium]|nr:cell division protein ZapA [Candidatus Cryptobacteroides caccocaballi]
MADQNITITIAGRKYCLKASSPEKEEIIRKAADVVNNKISYYQKVFAGKSEADLLSFVALNECITNLTISKDKEAMLNEVKALGEQLESYMGNID